MRANMIAISTVVILLTVLQNRIFPKKSNKAKMALLLPISFIYVIVGMVVLTKQFSAVLKLISIITAGVPAVSILFYPVALANILLAAGYLVIKILAAASLSRIKNDSGIITLTASTVYEYSDLYDFWFLQKEWRNFRTLMCVLKWGFTAASIFLLNCFARMSYLEYIKHDPRQSFNTHSPFALLFPIALALIFSEIHFFMNGITEDEYEHTIGGAEVDARKLGRYFLMREILERILPDALLSAQTGFELQGRTTSEII